MSDWGADEWFHAAPDGACENRCWFRFLLTDILAINWSQNSSQIAQLLSLQLNRYVFRAYL